MEIILDEKIVGLWFLPLTDNRDWLAGLRELVPDEKYELTYRFRYYRDDKVFDSADKKNWYEMSVSGTRNYAISCVRLVCETMIVQAIEPLYELLNEGDFNAFAKRYADAPFVFMRMLPPGVD